MAQMLENPQPLSRSGAARACGAGIAKSLPATRSAPMRADASDCRQIREHAVHRRTCARSAAVELDRRRDAEPQMRPSGGQKDDLDILLFMKSPTVPRESATSTSQKPKPPQPLSTRSGCAKSPRHRPGAMAAPPMNCLPMRELVALDGGAPERNQPARACATRDPNVRRQTSA